MKYAVLIFSLLSFFFCHSPLTAEELPVNVEFARHGGKVLGLVSFTLPQGYHAYTDKPASSGRPTKLEFILEHFGEAHVLYPAGVMEADIFNPKVKIPVYKDKIELLVLMPERATGGMYSMSLKLLLCSSRHCKPVDQTYAGNVPVNIPPLSEEPWATYAIGLLDEQKNAKNGISFEEGALPPPISAKDQAKEDQPNERSRKGQLLPENAASAPESFSLQFSPRYADVSAEIYSLGRALLMGIIAGLLLNVMPCVLPVLTLKVGGLIMMGRQADEKKLREFRMHNLCFSAGVITLFTSLALILGAADMIWGQLYQNIAVLLVMIVLVFLMGLSMLGVFMLPALDLHWGENTANPLLKAYLTGVVSTFLATPCSGPLLGGVLAWAFAQPKAILMCVFWSVGLGMSLPYIAFAIFPKLANMLPRPGNWMHTFERVLGYLLLATALYLLSIIPNAKIIPTLTALLAVAAGASLWNKYCNFNAPRWRRRAGNVTAVAGIALGVWWIMQPGPVEPQWQDFSPENFEQALGKQDMLVEFTADWCPNCKFLESSVLTAKNMAKWQKRYKFELIKVDLTQSNPYAEKLLSELGSRSIPMTALFPKGSDSRSPLVLRDLYGKDALARALKKTF